jgi:hypothetical protein
MPGRSCLFASFPPGSSAGSAIFQMNRFLHLMDEIICLFHGFLFFVVRDSVNRDQQF